MYKLLITAVVLSVISCSGKKSTEATPVAVDTLMDSTQMKMKSDTTIKMLDHLEDSINKLRNKAADKADQKN